MTLLSPRNKNENWKIRSGPGFLILATVFILVITAVIWRSGASWRWAALSICLILILFLLFIGQVNSSEFDLARQQILIRQDRIWKKSARAIPFSAVENVGVISSSSSQNGWTYKVVLVLGDGDQIQITAYPTSGMLAKRRLAKKIAATLNQFRTEKIVPALDGKIQTSLRGETAGLRWTIEFSSANERLTVTKWITSDLKYQPGFILLMPVGGVGKQTGGKVNKNLFFFYRQYLGSLLIDPAALPDFQAASVLTPADLPGSSYTCLASDPSAAKAWLNSGLLEKLERWKENQTLPGSKAEFVPHLLATPVGIQLIFRKIYNQEEDIRKIADFGVSLISVR